MWQPQRKQINIFWVRNSKGKRPFGRRHGWEDIIKSDIGKKDIRM
jgi:hypothetical protein